MLIFYEKIVIAYRCCYLMDVIGDASESISLFIHSDHYFLYVLCLLGITSLGFR